MTWFRRAADRADTARQDVTDKLGPQHDPNDEPAALLKSMFGVVAEVNRNAGKLPVEAVVIARAVLDVVREVIESAAERPLDIRAVIAIRGILEDYLPTTIRRYVAIDPQLADVPRPSGRTPSASLIEQLDVLWASAADLLDAIRTQDADALLTQGSFLRTKFSGSDLDL
jgi:hypothetical protein